MRVLIVEDDELKAQQLVDFVRCVIPESIITTCLSYQSGLAQAIQHSPQIMLLDMSLPNFDPTPFEGGYRSLLFAGRDILQELTRLRVATRVIVVTQFEQFGEGDDVTTLAELTEVLHREFSETFKGTVYYHPAQEDWKSALFALLSIELERGND